MTFEFDKIFDILNDKLEFWFHELIKILPNLLLAALLLVIGFFISKHVRRFAEKIFSKVSKNITINNLFSTFVYVVFLGIVIFTSLTILKLDKAVTSILAGAGILGLALAFAFQDIASNFISGIFISFRRPLQIGDTVSIKGYMGKVSEINLRDTVINTFQGKVVIIPNKDVFQNPIENFSLLGKRRLDLDIGISYGEDLERVAHIAIEAVKNIQSLSQGENVTLFYKEFGESSINFTIRLWCSSTEQIDYLKVGHQAIILIKKAFDEHGITIPFPIRTIDMSLTSERPK